VNSVSQDLKALLRVLLWYIRRKIHLLAIYFEKSKNLSVELLMQRRGALQSKVWHGSMFTLASVGLLTSGVFGGQSLVSSSYPGIGGPDPRFIAAFEPYPNGLIIESSQDTITDISVKPRAEIEDYEVQDGETISSIAKKFGISVDTIKWANDITSDSIKPGQTLKILPVTGIAHTVKSGDTLESVAKKYDAEAQAILVFPFNDVPDDFSLRVGQVLIVPEGVKPESATVTPKKQQPQYLAQGPSSPAFQAAGGAKFVWPTGGSLTQNFAWYHPGIDVANRAAPGISASDGGRVMVAGWPDNSGYGNRIVIDHGNGYQTLYAHLSNIYVTAGQTVSRGQIIGQMGSTGRSTGTHLHFEIHFKGVAVNPLAILK
jgi:murein DD-endopeptidase MepM/ murein hydrolase activator NlpD